ncbi:MAG: hypothetical protein CL434_14215 [Acidimicrobiaceae bacterium]|nr:hypothetical protein [Acidimicrobiaceae bacterium]
MRLEIVVGRIETLGEGPQTIQKGLTFSHIGGPVHVRAWAQLGQVHGHEGRVVQQLGQALGAGLKLFGEEFVMDVEGAELAAGTDFQLPHHQVSQPRDVWSLQAFQELCQLAVAELSRGQGFQATVSEPIHGVRMQAARIVFPDLWGDAARCESARKDHFVSCLLTGVIETQSQCSRQVVEAAGPGGHDPCWITGPVDQCLPVLDFAYACALPVALDPRLQERRDLVYLPLVLKLQAAVVVVVLSTGYELLQGLSSVLRKGEYLVESNLLALCRREVGEAESEYERGGSRMDHVEHSNGWSGGNAGSGGRFTTRAGFTHGMLRVALCHGGWPFGVGPHPSGLAVTGR